MDRLEFDPVRVMQRVRRVMIVRPSSESKQPSDPGTCDLVLSLDVTLTLTLLVRLELARDLLELTPDSVVQERAQEIRVAARARTRRSTHCEVHVERLRRVKQPRHVLCRHVVRRHEVERLFKVVCLLLVRMRIGVRRRAKRVRWVERELDMMSRLRLVRLRHRMTLDAVRERMRGLRTDAQRAIDERERVRRRVVAR